MERRTSTPALSWRDPEGSYETRGGLDILGWLQQLLAPKPSYNPTLEQWLQHPNSSSPLQQPPPSRPSPKIPGSLVPMEEDTYMDFGPAAGKHLPGLFMVPTPGRQYHNMPQIDRSFLRMLQFFRTNNIPFSIQQNEDGEFVVRPGAGG